MAFNFNWSPLIADTSRARDMLTTALNKSPKPPIIVDDIIVTELNLGSTPPELQIVEIGDLAEDRFRGIFRMSYTGDAFLTLKTKVQANPLNTYLSTKSDFASPQPLAAAASLTIPLQITLSDIKLSGFVILVFSKQKGITLVFQNDPLDSLKVSSTFDSIPFVRDYLQKEIEGQLRNLFMEDLPAIIHRLSLRLCSPEFQESESESLQERLDPDSAVPIDPLTTPPQDAIDAFGNPIDTSQISPLSLDPSSEMHASFSQKNILRLAALSDSQRTLSLFTPTIPEAVFRAWAGHPDRTDGGSATPALTRSSLSRIQSNLGSVRSHASSIASGSSGQDSHHTFASRPTLALYQSAPGGLHLGGNASRSSQMRKRKKRVVDLRKKTDGSDSGVSSLASTPLASTNVSETASVIPEEREEEALATPIAESSSRELDHGLKAKCLKPEVNEPSLLPPAPITTEVPRTSKSLNKKPQHQRQSSDELPVRMASRPALAHSRLRPTRGTTSPLLRSLSFDKVSALSASSRKGSLGSPSAESESSSSGGILEQAWMTKMAQEIAKKVQEQKEGHGEGRESHKGDLWAAAAAAEAERDAPPAYVA